MEENGNAKTKSRTRFQGSVSNGEIQQLRDAISQGYPWICEIDDGVYHPAVLNAKLNILLSYLTNIPCLEIHCVGDPHPSPETIAAVKAQLKEDIGSAEQRFKKFKIERWRDEDFRRVNPGQPPREEY